MTSTPSATRRKRVLLATAIAVVALIGVCVVAVARWDSLGCHVPLVHCVSPQFFARNDRADPVTVHVTDRNGDFTQEVAAGRIEPVVESCNAQLIVVTDPAGTQIARIDSVACKTTTLIMRADGTTQLVDGRVAVG